MINVLELFVLVAFGLVAVVVGRSRLGGPSGRHCARPHRPTMIRLNSNGARVYNPATAPLPMRRGR